METQLTTKKETAPVAYDTTSRAIWDEGDVYSSSDIRIPRITLVGNGSQLANEGKGSPGQILNSDGYTLLADKNQQLEVLPISVMTDWVKFQKIGANADFQKVSVVALPPSNLLTDKWTTDIVEEDKIPTVYKKRISCYVLSPSNDMVIPFTVSFKGLSAFSGSAISSHFQMSRAQGVPPIGNVFTLSSKLVEWNGKKHWALEAVKGRVTTDHEKAMAVKWRSTIMSKKVEVSTEEDHEEAPF